MRLRDQVDDPRQLGVVVRVGDLLEQLGAPALQLAGRVAEVAPRGEGDGQVVDHRRPAEQRCPLQGDGGGAGEGVLLVLTGAEGELPLEAAGQREGVALVGALVAEALAAGLARLDDLARSCRQPGLRASRRRGVAAGGDGAVDGDVLGCGHRRTLGSGVEQPPDEGVGQGLPATPR